MWCLYKYSVSLTRDLVTDSYHKHLYTRAPFTDTFCYEWGDSSCLVVVVMVGVVADGGYTVPYTRTHSKHPHIHPKLASTHPNTHTYM